ncbi:MAG TPA: hypothetical protein VMT20_16165 [Terriglobia bacterium]|nr:hypothetical protein [Terriglobia bacterium]
MKSQKTLGFLVTPALLLAGYLLVSTGAKATDETAVASPEVTKLLARSETEALELKHDAMEMEALSRLNVSWDSHANKINLIKEHVNKAGELLAELHAKRETAAPWQKQAIDEITPLLQKLAANTSATIERLNKGLERIHEAAYRDYIDANYHAADKLAALIGDYVDYGEALEKLELVSEKLTVAQD